MITAMIPPDREQCSAIATPMVDLLSRISGKWSLHVLMALMHGPRRFSDLRRQIEGISQKMLTQTLRDFEEHGLLRRTVTPSIPPRVDYELTQMGLELQDPLAAISTWAQRNRTKVAEARHAYAGRRLDN